MILVTGGAGVMGSKLVRGLLQRGERVRIIALPNDPGAAKLAALGGVEVRSADITDPASLEGAFDGIRTVYHLAAGFGGGEDPRWAHSTGRIVRVTATEPAISGVPAQVSRPTPIRVVMRVDFCTSRTAPLR